MALWEPKLPQTQDFQTKEAQIFTLKHRIQMNDKEMSTLSPTHSTIEQRPLA